MNYRTRTRSIRIRSSHLLGQPPTTSPWGRTRSTTKCAASPRFYRYRRHRRGLPPRAASPAASCLGGVSIGAFAFGGVSLGLLSLGGMAIGAVAIGGMAVGGVAIGGLAVGYYALGGNAVGKYVFSAAQRSDEAVAFFNRLLPGTK